MSESALVGFGAGTRVCTSLRAERLQSPPLLTKAAFCCYPSFLAGNTMNSTLCTRHPRRAITSPQFPRPRHDRWHAPLPGDAGCTFPVIPSPRMPLHGPVQLAFICAESHGMTQSTIITLDRRILQTVYRLQAPHPCHRSQQRHSTPHACNHHAAAARPMPLLHPGAYINNRSISLEGTLCLDTSISHESPFRTTFTTATTDLLIQHVSYILTETQCSSSSQHHPPYYVLINSFRLTR